MTADELQKTAEESCRLFHGGQCIPWGQATVLFNHGPLTVTKPAPSN